MHSYEHMNLQGTVTNFKTYSSDSVSLFDK